MTRQPAGDEASQSEPSGGTTRRLAGWKQIAANLGKDERTAKRWASERGLPVHRAPGTKRASVYAWPHEIEAWLKRDTPPTQETATAPAGRDQPRMTPRKLVVAAMVVFGCLAAMAVAVLPLSGTPGPTARQASQLPHEVSDLYLDAIYLWQRRTPQSLAEAERNLLRVIEMAPAFADAHAQLATVYNLMVEYNTIPVEQGYDRSIAEAERALALDAENVRAHTVLGDIRFFWNHDYRAGLAHFERAIAMDPNDALARHWHASALMAAGRFHDAAVEIERARQLDPSSRSVVVSAAMIALGLGRPESARASLLQLIENEPQYRSPYRFLAFAELALHDYPAYLAALNQRFALTEDRMGAAAAAAGLSVYADGVFDPVPQAMLHQMQMPDGAAPLDPYFLAHFLALNGQWLEAAAQLGRTQTRHAFYYSIDPAFAAARKDQPFLQKIADLGLPVVP